MKQQSELSLKDRQSLVHIPVLPVWLVSPSCCSSSCFHGLLFKRAGLSQAEKVKRSDMCHFLLVAVRSFLQSLASVCSIEGSLTEFDQVHRQTEAARLPGLKLNRLFFNSASRLLTADESEHRSRFDPVRNVSVFWWNSISQQPWFRACPGAAVTSVNRWVWLSDDHEVFCASVTSDCCSFTYWEWSEASSLKHLHSATCCSQLDKYVV